MGTTTSRVGLYKPLSDGSELVNVSQDLNGNTDKIDLAVGFQSCTSTTRPGTPYSGKPIFETDTNYRTFFSNGTSPASASWVEIPNSSGTFGSDLKLADTASLRIGTDTSLARPSTAQLRITPTANASASSSVGGALNITNTSSTGAGLVVYSTQAAPSGHLIVARANNATFNQNAIYTEYIGTTHAVTINHQGTGAASSAFNVASTNTAHSAVGISGVETGKGTLKITHTGTGTDGNAAGLSLDIAGTGTAAQGIFLTGVTTGDLIRLVNNAATRFSVAADGDTLIGGDINHDGTAIGFYGTAPIAKPTASGSRGGNAALASLLTALANLGLITNSTTA